MRINLEIDTDKPKDIDMAKTIISQITDDAYDDLSDSEFSDDELMNLNDDDGNIKEI